MPQTKSPGTRLWNLVREEKSDITAIYFFAIFGGLIQLSLPVGIQAIIGFVVGGTLSASLVVLISVLVIGVGITGLMQVNQMKVIERIQQRIFVRYSYAFADRIPKLDLKGIDTFYLPELVNRFFDTISLQKGMSKLLLDLPAAMIQILFGLILLAFYHPFFILFGILLLLLVWLILYFTGSKGLESSLTESSYKYSLVGWLEELARLVKSFKFSSSSGLHLQKANERTIGYLEARTKHFGVLILQYRTLVLFKVAITAAMLTVGVTLLLNQQINIGQFVAAEIIIISIISAVEKIIINLDSAYDVLTAVEKVNKLLDKPMEASGHYVLSSNQSVSVEGDQITFGYEPHKPIIQNVSFKIGAGEKVCICGNNGSGKSTILKLLTGVYKDFDGKLLINNTPIGNFDLNALRANTGILFPQENIFHGTLLENLTMNRPGIDLQYVSQLIMQVGLQPFFASQAKGFETELDPTGKRLSRNVIQKILLIRALANKPALLLMEEPWQGIEEPYKTSIQELLLQLPNTTVIVATQDSTFAERCDRSIGLT